MPIMVFSLVLVLSNGFGPNSDDGSSSPLISAAFCKESRTILMNLEITRATSIYGMLSWLGRWTIFSLRKSKFSFEAEAAVGIVRETSAIAV